MSDAPSPRIRRAAPSAAPANEVVINPNPTSSPNPIGSQAPPAPTGEVEGKGHRPQSRAESLRQSVNEAFDRASKPQVKPERPKAVEAKPAEAKPGHNNPPEETPKLNLKKRPEEQPARERAEHGHFAPKSTRR